MRALQHDSDPTVMDFALIYAQRPARPFGEIGAEPRPDVEQVPVHVTAQLPADDARIPEWMPGVRAVPFHNRWHAILLQERDKATSNLESLQVAVMHGIHPLQWMECFHVRRLAHCSEPIRRTRHP